MNKFSLFLFQSIIFMMVSCSTDDGYTEPDPTPEIPEISQEIINPQYVDIINSKVLHYDDNEYELEKSEKTLKLTKGSVAIVDCNGEHRIIVTESVDDNSSSIHIKAKHGDLCDIFANTTLNLSSQNINDTQSRNIGCTLTKVEVQNSDGTFIKHHLSTRTETNITSKLWEWESEDLTEEERTIFKSDNSKLWLSEATASLDLDINLTLSFGGREAVQEAYQQFRSKELKICGVLSGSFSSITTLSAEAFGSMSYQEDDDELVVHNVVKPIRLTFTTPSGIPVQAVLNADLRRGANFKAEGNIKASIGTTISASLDNGFEWEQSSGMSPISEANFTPEIIPPTIEGYGEITGKAWIYPRIFITLYNVLGPSFDIIPYIGTELSGGFRNTHEGSSDDFMALNLRGFAGVDFDAGFSLKRMNYETFRKSLGRFNILESNIFESPSRLETLSGQDIVPKVGTSIIYTIGVLDYYPWLQKEQLTSLPHIIVVETAESETKLYKVVTKGEVNVSWEPKSEDDFMKVTLYTPEGDVIDQLIYNVGEKPNEGYLDNSTYNGPIQILSFKNTGTEEHGYGIPFDYTHGDTYRIRFRLRNYPYHEIGYYLWAKNIKAVGFGDGMRLISSPDKKNITDSGDFISSSDCTKPLPDGIYETALNFHHYVYDYSNKPTPYFWFWLYNPKEEDFSYRSNKAIKVSYNGNHFSDISGGDLPQEILNEIFNVLHNSD